jgi:hypothetical protein
VSKTHVPLPHFERCDAFWAREETDRPLLAGWVGSYQVAELYPDGLSQLPEGELKPTDIDFELFRSDYERLFESHCQIGTDVPWVAFPVMVVPWVEAVLGCPIFHRSGNVWAAPRVETYGALSDDIPVNRDWLEVLLAFLRWLVKLSDGRFSVGLSLMRGPTDLLAAIRGAQRSVFDLFDCPERVESALQALTDVWIDVAHAAQGQIVPFAGGYGFSCQNLWSRRRGGWFQDDALALWSPHFYRLFARPCEERLARAMETTGIHLHSSALYVVDDLVEMTDLDVIEVNLDDVGLRILEMVPRFKQVLQNKRLFVWGAFTRDDLLCIQENLPTAGLALQLMADTPEGVRALVEEAQAIWGSEL